jgi:dolichol-phosphate mannosyltransferase
MSDYPTSLNGLLSVIIPCFNEEKLVIKAYEELITVLERTLSYADVYSQYEIIFVDDGSRDKTLSHLQALADHDPRVKIISFSRRFGKEAALSAGLEFTEGDLALLLDADLQDPPALIPRLLETYQAHQHEGCHIVYGIRTKRRGENWFMLILAKIYYRTMQLLADIAIPQDSADFKLIDKTVINAYRQLKEKNKFVRGLISWTGFKQVPFYYEREARQAGRSKFSLPARLKLATKSITYFSAKPLKLIKWLGLFSSLGGLGVLLWRVTGLDYLGWQLLFTGIQLTALGFVGEYVGNMFEEIKGRPEYIIKQCVNIEAVKKEDKLT